ncbi:MAG: zinc-binding alcohol dehydrogenase [Chloroflexi bacterium]|nr:zinc-binding alcohol dehydrogenase [Chloroflexota bacterium]
MSQTARSVWFTAPRALELRDEELPAPGDLDVRVEAIVSAISHGTEMLVYRGQVPPDLELDLPTLRGSFSFPIKYGYANVGRVVECGQAVERLKPGDIVFALHPHQSAYVLPERLALRLPDGVPPDEGVFLANLETAVNLVLDAAPRLGERVVVFGQGVVGLLVTQLMRRTGASLIVVVDPVAPRRELATRLGADMALEPGVPLRDLVPEGFDVAVELSGNTAALQHAVDSLAFGGTVVVASWYGTKPVQLSLGGAFHRRRLRLVSSQVSTMDGALTPRWTHARRLAVARDLLAELELEPLITHRLPLERAGEAYRLVDQRPEDTVQVVLTYD